MNSKSKSDQLQSTVVSRVHLSWREIWHTFHSEKLWFMSLVHFFPSTTITQDCLLFEGKPSTKHLHGSYGLCFPRLDPSAAWICVPILIIRVGLQSLGICAHQININKISFLLQLVFPDLSILLFFSCLLSGRSDLVYQWAYLTQCQTVLVG
jgi:hypothetical protein